MPAGWTERTQAKRATQAERHQRQQLDRPRFKVSQAQMTRQAESQQQQQLDQLRIKASLKE